MLRERQEVLPWLEVAPDVRIMKRLCSMCCATVPIPTVFGLAVDGCIKLNVDSSVIQPAGSGTCGGLLRNGDGNLVAGFMMKIGRITITFAEIWAIYIGMKLTVELEINRLQIETDSS
ncbi:hypothetical protein Ahy_A07g035768 [Arachis hypogaea]|uniref:RNase H type-1 domain-containing protein n=1 Tax=Arachis hypogaea TaxID=3818 RepID=A0A445CEH9_ARAHY|nr:hypothetical protein Ahy_A07g035768 [Arachis hypogaea]